jgi:hypothetical protein
MQSVKAVRCRIPRSAVLVKRVEKANQLPALREWICKTRSLRWRLEAVGEKKKYEQSKSFHPRLTHPGGGPAKPGGGGKGIPGGKPGGRKPGGGPGMPGGNGMGGRATVTLGGKKGSEQRPSWEGKVHILGGIIPIPRPAGIPLPGPAGSCRMTRQLHRPSVSSTKAHTAFFLSSSTTGGGPSTLMLTTVSPRRMTRPKARFISCSGGVSSPGFFFGLIRLNSSQSAKTRFMCRSKASI